MCLEFVSARLWGCEFVGLWVSVSWVRGFVYAGLRFCVCLRALCSCMIVCGCIFVDLWVCWCLCFDVFVWVCVSVVCAFGLFVCACLCVRVSR